MRDKADLCRLHKPKLQQIYVWFTPVKYINFLWIGFQLVQIEYKNGNAQTYFQKTKRLRKYQAILEMYYFHFTTYELASKGFQM